MIVSYSKNNGKIKTAIVTMIRDGRPTRGYGQDFQLAH